MLDCSDYLHGAAGTDATEEGSAPSAQSTLGA